MWALGSLQLLPSPELLQFLHIRAQAHFAALQPQEVAAMLWGAAQLQGVAAPPAAWVAECLQRQVGRSAWQHTQPRHYVMCLVACVQLGLVSGNV